MMQDAKIPLDQRSASHPVRRYWPIVGMGFLTIVMWSAVVYDVYNRQHPQVAFTGDNAWDDKAPLVDVPTREFSNETIVLDGKHFYDPTFKNVTFIYNGTGSVTVDNARVFPPNPATGATIKFVSRNKVVMQTVEIMKMLYSSAGCNGLDTAHPGPATQIEGIK